jgi:hypothetical protein
MRSLHWIWGIRITFNRDLIELSQEAFVDEIIEPFQMNDPHLRLPPINLNI